MRIAAHNGAHVWGGAERGTSRILAGMRERGHEVLLFCNDPRVAREAEALGVPTRILPLGGDVAIPHALRFARELRRLTPDVLLLGTFKKLWLGALAGRLAGVPHVVARIGLETDTPRNLKYRLVMSHWIDAIVLKADDVRPLYERALPGLPAERLVTIHGGIEPRAPQALPGAVRSELGVPDDAVVVGSVGRLVDQKRYDRFVRALARLPGEIHGLLAGDGAEREALAELAAAEGVAGRLHLLGHREDVGDVLAALDLFVVSSDREMLSFAMLEALAAGVPVVSTPVSGAAEALEPLEDGEAPGEVAAFSEEALAEALRRLATDPERRARMGAAARRRAAERFHFGRMLDAWERVLAGEAA
jgi:glycosyltransferase involved in cell wall biosynthesis